MGNIKKMAPILLILLYVATAFYMISNKADVERQYDALVSQARSYAGNGIVVDAMESYEQALALKPSVGLCVEAGEIYLDSGDYYSAKRWYQNQLLSQYPNDARTYEYGIRVYMAQEKYEDVFKCYDQFQAKKLESEYVSRVMEEIWYLYDLSGQFDMVSPFSNVTNAAAVEERGLWGYIDISGNRTIDYSYLTASAFSELAAVTDQAGSPYYIDTEGNIKISASQIENANLDAGKVVEFRGIESSLILAYDGKEWNYYDASSFQKKFGPFKDASKITNGVGAVSNDTGKWALIDNNGALITEYIFDGVLSDDKGVICRTNAVIACKEGRYILLDRTGTQIGTNSYDEARAFNDSSYAAMKRDNQWYFVDESGQELKLGNFEDADSFSFGLAAVKQNGHWGYITADGTLVIEYKFDAAGPFHQAGVSFVETETGKWSLLTLYRYHH